VRPELRAFAETPDRFTEIGEDVQRADDGRACILYGPTFAAVSGVNVAAAEVRSLLTEVRALAGATRRSIWLLGPSTRPPGLAARLRALGLADPVDRTPTLHCLALTTEPPPVGGVDVRRAETLDDYAAATAVQWDAFATPPERRLSPRQLEHAFRVQQQRGHLATFLGLADGRPAAVGRLVRSPRGGYLIGGAVAAWARGRGLYRALVRARYEHAAGWGTPALVTQAAPTTSLPILLRLGFQEVCVVERLEDPG
jgi:GNAT superfamily N-acetyltransferase